MDGRRDALQSQRSWSRPENRPLPHSTSEVLVAKAESTTGEILAKRSKSKAISFDPYWNRFTPIVRLGITGILRRVAGDCLSIMLVTGQISERSPTSSSAQSTVASFDAENIDTDSITSSGECSSVDLAGQDVDAMAQTLFWEDHHAYPG